MLMSVDIKSDYQIVKQQFREKLIQKFTLSMYNFYIIDTVYIEI